MRIDNKNLGIISKLVNEKEDSKFQGNNSNFHQMN